MNRRNIKAITILILSFLWLIVLAKLPISGLWKFILILLTWPILIPAVSTLAGIGASLLPIFGVALVGAIIVGLLYYIALPTYLIIIIGSIPLLIIGWMLDSGCGGCN